MMDTRLQHNYRTWSGLGITLAKSGFPSCGCELKHRTATINCFERNNTRERPVCLRLNYLGSEPHLNFHALQPDLVVKTYKQPYANTHSISPELAAL